MTIDELDARLVALAADERANLRTFLEHLIQFVQMDGPLAKAYPSLYVYCLERLRLSENESFRRMQAAYKAVEFPQILDKIEDGSINLTTIGVLSPHLTSENVDRLLESAARKKKRDVEALVAGLSTKAPPRDVIRIIPPPATPPTAAPEANPLFAVLPEAGAIGQDRRSKIPDAPPSDPSAAEPAVRIAFTGSRALLDKLERAKGLLRHKHPEGRLEHVLNEALEALLDRIDRARKEKPAAPRPVLPGRRRIPEWVKDAVHKRDGGRCAFQSVDGQRCEASEWLEFDHVRPFALGGVSDDPDNVRLLCRAHNQHRAREDFGEPAWTGGTFGADDEPEGGADAGVEDGGGKS